MLRMYFEKLISLSWIYLFQNFNFIVYLMSLFYIETKGNLEIIFFHGMKVLFSI